MSAESEALLADHPIASTDPDVWHLIQSEQQRQENTLELIASENHASSAVIAAMGTCLTNKYAEGYPGARYYGGCQFHDQIEDLARQRIKKLFDCKFANVQPHSGANANTAAFMALCNPGDTVLSMPLDSGGHLSHGMKINFSGLFYNIVHYRLDPATETIDYDYVASQARQHKPRMIICGYSAYPRRIDFKRFREIADSVGAYLMADVAHIAGLIVGGQHESPFPHAHVVTSTTHKTLRGPRGGIILTNDEELARQIDRRVFPGSQGGPLMHVIAAKAVAFSEALSPTFKDYAAQIVDNARELADALTKHGYRLVSGGTDNHLMLVDLRAKDAELTGSDAEKWLEAAGMITNKNGIPNDPRPPKVTSGLRLGTPAVTTRGLTEPHMRRIAGWIDRVLAAKGDKAVADAVRGEIVDLCKQFPMPH